MLKLKKYLRPFIAGIIVSILLLFVQSICDLNLPNFMSDIVNEGIIGGKGQPYILRIGLIMLLIALIGGVATIFVSFLSSRIATGVARNLRKDVFDKIETFSNSEYEKFSSASLITRATNDIMQVQMLLMMGIRLVCYAPIMGIGGIIMAVNKSVSMIWILGIAIVAIVGVIMILISIAMPKFKLLQKLVDKLNLVSRENLSGLMVIRAFRTQKYEKERFSEANDDLTKTNRFLGRAMSVMMPMLTIIMNGITLLVIWVGAHQISQATMQVGDMMAYMQYAMQVLFSFMMLSMIFIMVPRAAVSAGRIAEVLETKPAVVDAEVTEEFACDGTGVVEFRDVDFRYPGAEEDALSDITFTAKPGETTAIIGPTGSGKSTIAGLALRFFDVTKGEVLVDGTDVRKVPQIALRDKIGYVPQKGQLLSGSVDFNIRYGDKDVSEDVIKKSADIAKASDFISKMPEGYESNIAQGGANVSGGQKQRLSIARALAKNPEILIFDDSFSALDFATDQAVRNALKKQAANTTQIIVAQRVSTIITADQILVIDDGRIVGKGTHKELLKTCPEYHEIASSQLSAEELGEGIACSRVKPGTGSALGDAIGKEQ